MSRTPNARSFVFFRAMTFLVLLSFFLPSSLRADATLDDIEFFENRVRPILFDHCLRCHSGDKPKAKLRLDSRANLLKGGDSGPAVVPGEPEKSLLVKAIRHAAKPRMPPPGKLAEQHVADLTAWVKMGAPWTETDVPKTFDRAERKQHWAWQPLKVASPPAEGGAWVQAPIDAFILNALQAKGLTPAKPADRRTLLRRVTFDLTGLPPTTQEIEDALHDKSPAWFEKVVDRLLASPHYGERWARHWLDLVRFAETYGHELDLDIPDAHGYRDYIIRALNTDLPYDQFVLEHIAGDLLPTPRRHPTDGSNESILGTGFWLLGDARHSPADLQADEADRIHSQIDVFARTFLGLSVACARCHDHKFDAISTKDYYALSGYLHSSRYQHAFIDSPDFWTDRLREVQKLQTQARKTAVNATARTVRERTESLAKFLLGSRPAGGKEPIDAAARQRWLVAMGRTGAWRPEHFLFPWMVLSNHLNEDAFIAVRKATLNQLKAQAGRAVDAEKKSVVLADFGKETFRDWFVSGEAFGTGPTRAPVALLAEKTGDVKQVVGVGVAHSGLVSDKLKGVLRSKTFVIPKKKLHFHVAGKGAQVNLVIDGQPLIRDPFYGGLTLRVEHGDVMTWRVMDVSLWVGHKAYIEIIDDGPGFVAVDRIIASDDTTLPPPAPNYVLLQMLDNEDVASPEALAKAYEELVLATLKRWRAGELGRDDTDRVELLSAIVQSEPLATLPAEPTASEHLTELLDQLRQAEAALPEPRRALALMDGSPWNARVLIRGNAKDVGDEVPRRFLEVLSGAEQPAPGQGSGRLDLAKRVLDPANPLLPRVLVNRVWRHHFGEGIVRTVDNFGVLGEGPTHPELLDYLAADFVRQGWSLKALHRQLLLSSTYQMSSKGDDRATELDPKNQLLHRMPVRRLEAEAIRDAILALGGRLDTQMYGPSVLPFLTPQMYGPGRPIRPGPLDGDGRRSIYINVRRNFLTPLLTAFDYPAPYTTTGKRTETGTALPKNDAFVQHQVDQWLRRAMSEPGLTVPQRITKLYTMAFGRPPQEAELKEELKLMDQPATRFNVPAWVNWCQGLLNRKEFLFID